MSPFREALLAGGHGEWAFVAGELVRVAREQPLQLSSCTLPNSGDNRAMATKRTGGSMKKRTPAARSRTAAGCG